MSKYRGGVIGLGWMGMLSDLEGKRTWDRYDVDDVDRPMPELNVHREFHFHDGPGEAHVPHTWAEAMWDRPEVDLVAGSERDPKRLKVFTKRYGVNAVYTDAKEMLRQERLDIVAIATNVKGRADLTCLAVECGVKGIATEKPMAHTLEEADRMVKTCADAGVSLSCGAIPVNHPSYATAKALIGEGAIGEVISIQAEAPAAQKQNWSYFVDSAPAWVVGSGEDQVEHESESNEFVGQGMMLTVDGGFIFFRKGAGLLRVTGSAGEIALDREWRIWQDLETPIGKQWVELQWPGPRLAGGYNAVYGLADIIDCLEGRLDEPKNSGRRVAVALEVEVALKVSSAKGGVHVGLPLEDRSLGLRYTWFR